MHFPAISIRGLATLIVTLGLTTLLHAQLTPRIWQSDSNQDFGRNGNWSGGRPDNNTEAAVFNGTGNQTSITMNANRTIGGFVFTSGTNAITFNRNGGDRLVQIDTANEPDSLGILHQKAWTTHTFNSRLQLNSDQIWRTTADGGKLVFTDDINLQSHTLTLDPQSSNQGSITFTGADGVITGTGGLTLDGAGSVFITGGSHTYTGATTVNSGVFQLNASNVLSDSSDLVINSGGTFQFNWGSLSETMGSLSGDGTLSIRGASFTTNTSANTTFAGTITDSYGQFHKDGTGTLTLSGSSTYSGKTYIDGGTLIAASDTALGSATYGNEIANGATLGLQGNINLAESNFSLQGTGDGGVGAINNISGDNTLGASLSFTGATTIGATAGSLTLTNALDISNAVTFTGAGDIVASGQAYGSSSVTKNGTGTLTLSGTSGNSYSGGTYLNDGTLVLAKSDGTNALGSGGVINVGDGSGAAASANLTLGANNQIANSAGLMTIASDGRFNVGSYTESINQLAGTGQLDLGTGNLTVGVNSGSSTFSGTISGTGNFTKAGSGTVTLDGSSANTATGTTTITGGTLALNKSTGNAISGNITLGDSSGTDVLRLDASNQIADTSNLTFTSSGKFDLNNHDETIGSISAASSTAAIALGSGTLTTGTTGSTFAGVISGSGNLVTAGSNALTLSGANTFSGDITVSSGTTLIATSDDALGSGGGDTTVQSGATLELSGGITADTEDNIYLAGTGTSGQGAVLSSSGDNILDSTFTLTGDTTISATADTLTIGTQANSPVFYLAGHDLTLNTDGGDITFEADFTNAGDVYKTGSGTLLLNHSEAYPAILDPSTTFYLQDGTTILNTYNNENTGMRGDVVIGDGVGAAGSAILQQGTDPAGVGLSNNLIADSSNITINADGHWDLQGFKETINSLTLDGGSIDATGGDRLDVTSYIHSTSTTQTATITGQLGLAGDAAKDIDVASGSILDISAVVSSGGIEKNGDGQLILSAYNSYEKITHVTDGVLTIEHDHALGQSFNSTTTSINGVTVYEDSTVVDSGAQLQLSNVEVAGEELLLYGTGQNNDGTGALQAMAGTSNAWSGAITLASNSEIQTSSGAFLNISGNITGSGKTLTMDSIGNTTWSGNNTFNTLNKTGAGTLTVSGSNTYATANVTQGTYALGASNILANTMDVNLGASGTFNVGTYTDVIDDLTGSGSLTIASGGDLTIDQIGGSLTSGTPSGAFTGTLDVDGILTLNGGTIGAADGTGSTGTIELTANNTLNIAGNFTFGGTLELADNTTLNLVGSGTTFNVDTLRVTGDSVIDFAGSDFATLNIGTLEIDIGGTIFATSWDQYYDLWTATNFNGATLDERNGTTAQITFDGFSASDTIWLTYDYGPNEITVPEPSTYGALLMGTALAGYLWRRRRQQLKAKLEA